MDYIGVNMFTQADKDRFFDAVESLKKYRRADLIDEKGKNLLEALYVGVQTIKAC